jgi:hypothetical protein
MQDLKDGKKVNYDYGLILSFLGFINEVSRIKFNLQQIVFLI